MPSPKWLVRKSREVGAMVSRRMLPALMVLEVMLKMVCGVGGVCLGDVGRRRETQKQESARASRWMSKRQLRGEVLKKVVKERERR